MAVQYGHDIDLLGLFQLLRAKAQVLASDPTGLGTGDEGRFWYNSTSKRVKWWSGTAAIDVSDLANSVGSLTHDRISNFSAGVTAHRLDQLSQPTTSVNGGGQKYTNMADGTAAADSVNRGQLDAVLAVANAAASGVAIKRAARAVATTNITLSGTQTVDGVALVANDRVLVAGQTTASQNGIYVVASTAWARAADADEAGELAPGTQLAITEGATAASAGGNRDSIYRLVTDTAITIGTTAQTWERLPGATGTTYTGGAGLVLTGNDFAVGAGDGILVDADAVRVNPNRTMRKRTGTVPTTTQTITTGDGTTMSVTVTGNSVAFAHNLANQGATISMVYGSSPGTGNTQGQRFVPDPTSSPDGNTLTVALPTGYPTANQLVFSIEG